MEVLLISLVNLKNQSSIASVRVSRLCAYIKPLISSHAGQTARRNKRLRKTTLKHIYVSANEIAKKRYNSYLSIISKKIEAGEFPSDAPKDELMEEALLGIRNGKITPQILVLIRTKKITRKMIRDDTVKVVLDDLGWKLQEDSTDKQQSKSKNLSTSGIGDKETEV